MRDLSWDLKAEDKEAKIVGWTNSLEYSGVEAFLESLKVGACAE